VLSRNAIDTNNGRFEIGRERIAVDNVASEKECARIVGALRAALNEETAGEKQIPVFGSAPEKLLGEDVSTLLKVVVERIQSQLEAHWGTDIAVTSGGLLGWIDASKMSLSESGAYSYTVPHVDQANVASYEFSCVLYLNNSAALGSILHPNEDASKNEADEVAESWRIATHNKENSNPYWFNSATQESASTKPEALIERERDEDRTSGGFEGGNFAFNDIDGDLLIAPRRGRLLAFTSGPENLHQVYPVTNGDRFTLAVWFTRLENVHRHQEDSGRGPGGGTDSDTGSTWRFAGSIFAFGAAALLVWRGVNEVEDGK
jgi:hypothetical protein